MLLGMLNIGPGELLAIAALALIVLGPDRLPGALRQVGRAVGELRRISGGFQDELRRAMDDAAEPDAPTLPPLPETKAEPATPATAEITASGDNAAPDPAPAEVPPVIPPEEAAGLDLPSDRDDGDDDTDSGTGDGSDNGVGAKDESESSTVVTDDEPASVTDDVATEPEKPTS